MAVMSWREPNQVNWVGVRPAHCGEQVLEHASAEYGSTVVYTVPAGKTFYLSSFVFYFLDNTGGGFGSFVLYDNTDAVFSNLIAHRSAPAGAHVYPISLHPPIEIPAAYYLSVVSGSAAVYSRVFIHGWVE